MRKLQMPIQTLYDLKFYIYLPYWQYTLYILEIKHTSVTNLKQATQRSTKK